MKELLYPFLDTEIGLNINKPFKIESTLLKAIHADYFSVKLIDSHELVHIPYRNIVKIRQNSEGIMVGGIFQQNKSYKLIIKVGHVVEYINA